MAIILFDNQYRKSFFPITATKALGNVRLGILKLKDWWQLLLQQPVFIATENYLQHLYPLALQEEHIFIDAAILPDENLIQKINELSTNQALIDSTGVIAGKTTIDVTTFNPINFIQVFDNTMMYENVTRLKQPFHFFQYNEKVLKAQCTVLTKNKSSQKISSTNKVINETNIFIEEGAIVEHCILNASTGFIYIGKNATVMEGSIIRGAVALCENAVVKAGAKIYGATTIGINAVAGGEIKNAIIGDYSNKAHDGYLGDSIIGEWCNLGAGTSNSNVKNNAGDVLLWNNYFNQYENAGKKCGVVMGDYSRTAINTSINTGSNIGVCCNVFGVGLMPTLLNHFSWGIDKQSKYKLDKAMVDINNWKQFKGKQISEDEVMVLKYIFEHL